MFTGNYPQKQYSCTFKITAAKTVIMYSLHPNKSSFLQLKTSKQK